MLQQQHDGGSICELSLAKFLARIHDGDDASWLTESIKFCSERLLALINADADRRRVWTDKKNETKNDQNLMRMISSGGGCER